MPPIPSPAAPSLSEGREIEDMIDRARVIAAVEAGRLDARSARTCLAHLAAGIEGNRQGALHDPLGGPLPQAERQALHFRIGSRETLLGLMQANYRLREAVIGFAETHRQAIYLHCAYGEPAEPRNFGHWALMADSALARDSERMVALYNRINRSPAGAASGNGAEFGLNRLMLADLLGFDGLVENTLDAAQSRDLVLECAGVLAIWAQTLAGIVTEILGHASPCERRMVLPLWVLRPSLLKSERAPEQLLELRHFSTRAIGFMSGLFTSESAASGPVERLGNQRQLGELANELAVRLEVLARVFEDLELVPERGTSTVTDAVYRSPPPELTRFLQDRSGLSWTDATLLIDAALRDLDAKSRPLSALAPEDIARAAKAEGFPAFDLSTDELRSLLAPELFIAHRNTIGGPGADSMASGIISAQARIRLGLNRLDERRRQVDAAGARLRAAMKAI
ncbi:lyase family protein (plasmid) [Thioclava sp. 'Guangxiensis']|uniref:lyase family protein n=1 Tax=Thioclava sp. 'Guangxiensis' TaxID=3149044 RepID=UPI0038781802